MKIPKMHCSNRQEIQSYSTPMDYTSGFLFAGSFGLEKLTQRRQFLAWTLFPVTKQEIEDHFNSHHGSGKITEIKLMSGFGFIEYEDAMDAKDVVPGS